MTDDEWRARAERGEWLEEPGTGAWVRWSGDWRITVYPFGRGWDWEVRPPKGEPGIWGGGSDDDPAVCRLVADLVCEALQRAALPVLDAQQAADVLGLELAP